MAWLQYCMMTKRLNILPLHACKNIDLSKILSEAIYINVIMNFQVSNAPVSYQ
jgi:hypothetical protein